MVNGTVISGTFKLTSADSPVLVAGVLDISSGGSLVIGAGTVVIFETPSSGINVNFGGQLLVTGAFNNRVVLKAHQDSWNGITFKAGSIAGVFDSSMKYMSGSTIQYADIIRSGYSTSYQSTSGLSLQDGIVPYILGVDMISCGNGRVIDINNFEGVAAMRNLRVLNSNETASYYPGYGLYVIGNDINAGKLVLENLNFESASGHYSIYVASINQVSVLNSYFSSLVYFDHIKKGLVQGTVFSDKLQIDYFYQVEISGNSIQNGLDISYMLQSSMPSFVTNNMIINGRLYYNAYYWYYYSVGNVTISGNTVQGSSYGGLYINNANSLIIVSNNTVKECSSTYYPVVDLRSIYDSFGLEFTNNTVIDSSGTRVFQLEGSSNYATTSDFFSGNIVAGNSASDSLIFFNSYPWSRFTANLFDNNTAPFSVKLDMPNYDQFTLPLPLNHWGNFQADILDLRATVDDGLISASQPLVDFDPVLSEPSLDR